MKRLSIFKTVCALVLALAMFIGAESAFAEPWKFGVMSDTQWTCATDPAGTNPNAVSASIIQQINRQFINHGVKFVIQVGDLTDNGNDADIAVRAAAAQPLIDAGIGFFPMRGNHETYATPANNYAIPAFRANFPQTRGLSNTFGATNFNSPTSVSPDLTGMSYSFDYGDHGNEARFVIIDDWATPSKESTPLATPTATPSPISRLGSAAVLTSTPAAPSTPSSSPTRTSSEKTTRIRSSTATRMRTPTMQNAFFASLQNNEVKYYISGHDHIHQRSIIKSPDGFSNVQETHLRL